MFEVQLYVMKQNSDILWFLMNVFLHSKNFVIVQVDEVKNHQTHKFCLYRFLQFVALSLSFNRCFRSITIGYVMFCQASQMIVDFYYINSVVMPTHNTGNPL